MQRFVILLLCVTLFGCASGPPLPAVRRPLPDTSSCSTVYVIRRGWHIDIGLAAADVSDSLKTMRRDLPQATYFTFGFGDRRYLITRHDIGSLLEALWPGDGLLLVTGLISSPQDAFGTVNVVAVAVSDAQMSALQHAIAATLDTVSVGALAEGPYGGSVYYAARERYSALHTCNTWAARTLQRAGLPFKTRGVVFAGQVWSDAKAICTAAWCHPNISLSRPNLAVPPP